LSPRTGLSFSAYAFWKKLLRAPRGLAAFPFVGATQDFLGSSQTNDRGSLRDAPMLPYGLTATSDESSVFVRGFSIAARS
jgi:hypothetical protein